MHFLTYLSVFVPYLYLCGTKGSLYTDLQAQLLVGLNNVEQPWTSLNIENRQKVDYAAQVPLWTRRDSTSKFVSSADASSNPTSQSLATAPPDAQTWAKSTSCAMNGFRILGMMSGSENVSPCSTKTSSPLQMPPDSSRCRGTPCTRLSRRTTSLWNASRSGK